MKRNVMIKKIALAVTVLFFVAIAVLLLVVATVSATQNPDISRVAETHTSIISLYFWGFGLCIAIVIIFGAIISLRKTIARKNALESRQGFIEALEQIEELEINSDVEKETLEKSTDLKADLMLAIQLTPTSKVDWIKAKKEVALLKRQVYRLLCSMSCEISSAKEARRGALFMEELSSLGERN